MNPTLQQVHNINERLTNFSLMTLQSKEGFVADQVFPVMPVAHQASSYFVYPRDSFNRPMMKQRAPGTKVEYMDYDITSATYNTTVWAGGKAIDAQVRANADAAISLDLEATDLLTLQLLLQKEKLWSSAFFASGVWTTQYAGVSSGPSGAQFLQWNNSSSTPVDDVRTVKRAIRLASGNVGTPNALVLGRQVYDTLLSNPQIVARILYSVKQTGEAALVTKDTLAQLFEVDRVLVMDAIQNTAVQGASESNAYFGGKSALLAYVPGTPGLRSPAAGLNFTWNEYGPSRITSYEWLPTRSTHVELEAAFAYQLVSADLGGFFATAIA